MRKEIGGQVRRTFGGSGRADDGRRLGHGDQRDPARGGGVAGVPVVPDLPRRAADARVRSGPWRSAVRRWRRGRIRGPGRDRRARLDLDKRAERPRAARGTRAAIARPTPAEARPGRSWLFRRGEPAGPAAPHVTPGAAGRRKPAVRRRRGLGGAGDGPRTGRRRGHGPAAGSRATAWPPAASGRPWAGATQPTTTAAGHAMQLAVRTTGPDSVRSGRGLRQAGEWD